MTLKGNNLVAKKYTNRNIFPNRFVPTYIFSNGENTKFSEMKETPCTPAVTRSLKLTRSEKQICVKR